MSKTLTRKILSASTVGILALGAAACSSDETDPIDDPVEEVDPGLDEVEEDTVEE